MNNSIPSINLIEYKVYNGNLQECFATDKLLINTINQYSYCIAEKDSDFKTALQQSDILLPDGVGIVSAVRLLTGEKIKKIAGADIHQYLLEELNRKKGSCFYLGSSSTTLQKISNRLSKEYPNIKVGVFSPPFKKDFSDADNLQMKEVVNAFRPDVLFVGMTAPKQEKWSFQHKIDLNVSIICSIGAVFDFYAGTIERPSPFWINIGLEWFVRLLKEPSRMWKRYLYYGPVFIASIFAQKIKTLKSN